MINDDQILKYFHSSFYKDNTAQITWLELIVGVNLFSLTRDRYPKCPLLNLQSDVYSIASQVLNEEE